jgi:hypothetical protein
MRLKERPFLLEIAVARRRSPFPFGAVFAFGEPGASSSGVSGEVSNTPVLLSLPRNVWQWGQSIVSAWLGTEATQFADRKRPLT